MRRITAASLNGNRPAQISTSAWRGENAMRSMPNRARSNRLAAVAMNSMAQHAVPNGMGHNELAREVLAAQLISASNRVASQFGLLSTAVDSRTVFTSIPLQRSALPDIDIAGEENRHEHHHFDQPEQPQLAEHHAPGDQEHGLDVEHD